jgi:hypothetical protein
MSASQFPPLESKQSDKRCSNCSSIMSLYQLPGHYGQPIDIDVCLDCNAIWFDQWESSRLSPDGVVSLFQLINERGGTASSAGAKLGEGLRCVSCGDGMKLVNDRVKNTRFVYQSCRQGHGRLTTFYNFLSEKQFVRELTQVERTKLCSTVRQIKCSGCGAPVDLAKHDACSYCRAPVSVFDRDAAKKAIDHYLRERQKQVSSERPSIDYGHSPRYRDRWDTWDTLYAADLATDLLWALGRAASRGLSRAVPAGAGAAGAGAGTVLADTGAALSNVPGGLMDSLGSGTLATGVLGEAVNAGGAPLATATDLLFGESSAIRESNLVTSAAAEFLGNTSAASGAFDSASTALPSATEALFGSSNASDVFNAASSGFGEAAASGLGDAASGAMDAVSDHLGGDVASGIGDSLGDVASSAGDGVVDLVSDGIGSLISSIFS